MINSERLIFIVVVIVAAFFRLYNLNNVPPSPSVDEVSTGYNAYSILKTGRDEYGTFLPLVIRAYDDWQPALYTYLVIPFIAVFDLSVFAVRLPSAILSIITVVTSFFIFKKLFESTAKVSWFDVKLFSIITTFLLAISPWNIYVSRLGLPTNAGFSFFILALFFFLIDKFYFSAFFFSLSFMTYHADKIFIPFFIIGLALIYKEKWLKQKRKMITTAIISVFIVLPFIISSLSSSSLTRFKATNTVKLDAHWEQNQKREQLFQQAIKNDDIIGTLQHSREFFLSGIILKSYLSHFSPEWLFLNSGNEPHKVPGFGLLSLWTAPFIFVGAVIFFSSRFPKKTKQLIIVWLITAPIAGSITTGAPHALRAYTMIPVWEIFALIGVLYIYNRLHKDFSKKIYVIILTSIIFLSFLLLFSSYFTLLPKLQSQSFQYSLSQAMKFISKNNSSYKKIVFSNQEQLYQSYMFFLFHSKYDPVKYLQDGGTKSGGFSESHTIGQYEFKPLNWEEEEKNNILFCGRVNDFPKLSYSYKILETFSALDGTPEILIVEEKSSYQ